MANLPQVTAESEIEEGSAPPMSSIEITRKYLTLFGPLGMILLLSLVMLIQAPHFFRWANLSTVMVDAALFVILAVGMTFVITAKGIDLSIGSIMVFSAVVMAAAIKDFGVPTWIAMIMCVLVGAACGAFNGILITRLGIPDFIVTLATDLIFRGLGLVYAAGAVFYRFDDLMAWFGRGRIAGLQVSIIFGLVAMVVGHVFYKHHRFGRHVHAVGGNRVAARRLGIPVTRIRTHVYIMSGALAGFAGIVVTGRLDAIQATQMQLANLHTIAAVIIGGTSLFGGRGSVLGAALGAFLLSMITNSMVLLGFSFFWQQVAGGAVIIIAVVIYTLAEPRSGED